MPACLCIVSFIAMPGCSEPAAKNFFNKKKKKSIPGQDEMK